MRRDPNAWRYALDPRDPDYDDPPEQVEEDDEPHADDFDDTDPRCADPYHYIPQRNDV